MAMETIMCILGWIWDAIRKPINQSLILILLTVFVLGCQLALWTSDQVSVWADSTCVVLLILYLVKNVAVLLKEIKEVATNGGNNLPPTCDSPPPGPDAGP
jgi:hypothetical protein